MPDSVTIRFGASGISETVGQINQLERAIGGIARSLAGPLLAATSFAGLGMLAKQALDAGASLANLRDRTSMSIPALVAFQHLLKQSGESAEDAGNLIKFMQRNIAEAAETGGPAAKVFEQLKVNVTELSAENPAEQFNKLAAALEKMQNPALRTQIAMAIFGRSGQDVVALSKHLADFNRELSNPTPYAQAMTRSADLFRSMDYSLSRLAEQPKNILVGAIEAVGPEIKSFVDSLGNIDLTPLGTKIGNLFGVVIESAKNKKLPEMISLLIEAGFELGTNAARVHWNAFVNDVVGSLGKQVLNLAMTIGVGLAQLYYRLSEPANAAFSALLNWIPEQMKYAFDQVVSHLKASFAGAINWVSDKLNVAISYWIDELNKVTSRFGGKPIGHSQIPKLDDRVDIVQKPLNSLSDYYNQATQNSSTDALIKGLQNDLDKARLTIGVNVKPEALTAIKELTALIEKYKQEHPPLQQAPQGGAGVSSAAGNIAQITTGRDLDNLLKDQIALQNQIVAVQGKLSSVETNYLLTDVEKYKQRIELLKQEKGLLASIVADMDKRAKLLDSVNPAQADEVRKGESSYQGKLNDVNKQMGQLGPDPTNFSQSFSAAFKKIQSEGELTWQKIATTFKDTVGTAVNTLSQNFTKLIMGTETWNQALMNIGNTILSAIIEQIVSMAAAAAIAWAVPAILSTIGSGGSTAAAAPSMILGALSMSFAEGGYTGSGGKYDTAGLVHAGEFVMPADATQRIGLGNLEMMRQGGSPVSGGSGGAGGSMIAIHNHASEADMRKYIFNHPEFDKHVVNTVNRNVHRIIPRRT